MGCPRCAGGWTEPLRRLSPAAGRAASLDTRLLQQSLGRPRLRAPFWGWTENRSSGGGPGHLARRGPRDLAQVFLPTLASPTAPHPTGLRSACPTCQHPRPPAGARALSSSGKNLSLFSTVVFPSFFLHEHSQSGLLSPPWKACCSPVWLFSISPSCLFLSSQVSATESVMCIERLASLSSVFLARLRACWNRGLCCSRSPLHAGSQHGAGHIIEAPSAFAEWICVGKREVNQDSICFLWAQLWGPGLADLQHEACFLLLMASMAQDLIFSESETVQPIWETLLSSWALRRRETQTEGCPS